MAGRTHSLAGCGSRCRDGRRLFSLESDFGRTGLRMRLPRLILFWLTLAITLIAAPPAHAHLMNTGFGPFNDGLTHLFVTPEDLLPVIAIALMAGLRGPRFGRAVLLALPVALASRHRCRILACRAHQAACGGDNRHHCARRPVGH